LTWLILPLVPGRVPPLPLAGLALPWPFGDGVTAAAWPVVLADADPPPQPAATIDTTRTPAPSPIPDRVGSVRFT
jgi:hypothetical protein